MTGKMSFCAIRKAFYYLLCNVLVAFVAVGCTHDVYDSNNGDKEKIPNSFDFATTNSIQLNVKFNVPQGYKVLFDVYFENPFFTNDEGQEVLRTDISPAVRRMTDDNGEYHSTEVVSADHGSDVYIYTDYIGVPGLHKTTITDNTINADIDFVLTDGGAQTRAAGWSAPKGYLTLGTWQANGRPDYLDTEGELELSASILNTINKTIPERGTCDQKYRQSADFEINDDKNRPVEVSVRFIGSGSSAASAFGYYCYKSGASTEQIEKAKRCIIFPNTYTGTGNYNKPIGLKGGECVKLHYIDENGVDQGTIFPNGVKIGWFLMNNAYKQGGTGGGTFFSTTELNPEKPKRTHTAAFRIDDFVVLSFEDWDDQDYNDVQFNIFSNPIEAILPDVPPVDPEGEEDSEGSCAYIMTYKGILAYEDNWPNKGDYDLNDVIVKYNSVMRFNTKNEVLSTEDTFTALWSGASFKNGFAYELNTDRTNVVTTIEGTPEGTYQGLDPDLSKATVNVFLNALTSTGNNAKTTEYKIKNTLNTPVDHKTFGIAPYNPFIMVHENLGSNRCEVHLVNHKPTDKANMSLFGTEKDLSNPTAGTYYVAAENYPFAINLVDAETFSTTEYESVDKSYPDFIKWVNSKGTEYKDWYK